MVIVGLFVGFIFGLVNLKEVFGFEVFSLIVFFVVVIILFEGSSNLDFRELKGIFKVVIRIIIIGVGIVWILGVIVLYVIMNFFLFILFVIGGLFLIIGLIVI